MPVPEHFAQDIIFGDLPTESWENTNNALTPSHAKHKKRFMIPYSFANGWIVPNSSAFASRQWNIILKHKSCRMNDYRAGLTLIGAR